MSDEDRLDRVRKRQRRKRDASNESDTSTTSKESGTSDTSSASKKSDTSKASKTDGPQPSTIRDRTNHSFYLTDGLKWKLQQTELHFQNQLTPERVDYEKNRHFRPLLLHLGAQQLAEMDFDEIAEMLNNTEYLDPLEVDDE